MKNHKRPEKARAPEKAKNDKAQNGNRHSQAGPSGALRLPAGQVLFGVHAVHAALVNPARDVIAVYVTESTQKNLPPLPRALRPILCTRAQLDDAARGAVHQGVLAVLKPLPEQDLDDVIRAVDNAGQGLVLLLDQVTDPHNVGAILRSAAVFGAAAVILTDRNAPAFDDGVLAKSASGALEAVPLVRVVNLARTLSELGTADFWRIGLGEGGELLTSATLRNLPPKVALVLGAEGDGLRRLTKEHCDALLALPAAGGFSTLNVSNAAAVALYAVRQALPNTAKRNGD